MEYSNIVCGIVSDPTQNSVSHLLKYFFNVLNLEISCENISIADINKDEFDVVLYFGANHEFCNTNLKNKKIIIITKLKNLTNDNYSCQYAAENILSILMNVLNVLEDAYKTNYNKSLTYEKHIVAELIVDDYNSYVLSKYIQQSFIAIEDSDTINLTNTTVLLTAGNKQPHWGPNKIEIYGENNITFDLRSLYSLEIKLLKILPDLKPCVIANFKFMAEYEDGKMVDLKIFRHNAFLIKYEKYYFDRNDPEIIFEEIDICPIYIHVSFSIENLSTSDFFIKEKALIEIKNNYEKTRVKDFILAKNYRENNLISTEVQIDKALIIHLGPKIVNLEKLQDFLMDSTSKLIYQKVMYPSHQLQSYDLQGHGGLFLLFSTNKETLSIVFDQHKANNIKTDFKKSSFKFLVLSSENFLEGNRLMSIEENFNNIKYIYYIMNSIVFDFGSYQDDVFWHNETKKFCNYSTNKQLRQIISIIKYISKDKIELKCIDKLAKSEILLVKDIEEIISVNIPLTDNYNFNNSSQIFLSAEGLEFKRLINHFKITDNEINVFLNSNLIAYNTNKESFIFLTHEMAIERLIENKQRFELILKSFNFPFAEIILSLLNYNDYQYVPQEIDSSQILKIFKFLLEKDSELYKHFVSCLKLQVNIETDNYNFNNIIRTDCLWFKN